MITENLLYAVMLLIIGVTIVFLFLGIIFISIYISSKIFKNVKIKISPDKSIVQDSEELEEIAAITAALTFLRESRYRYASLPEKGIQSNWNNL